MRDLRTQLSDYVDGIARPVNLSDAVDRDTRPAVRSQRALVAVIAGAAVILVPALVAIGIWQWTDRQPATNGPASTVATTTTTTRLIPATMVTVPDVVGMEVAEAQETLDAADLTWTVASTVLDPSRAGTVLSQAPLPGLDVEAGTTVVIDVAAYPLCSDWHQTDPLPGPGERQITLLFECAPDGNYPNISTPVVRLAPDSADPVEATLQALLTGPTEAERDAGFVSFFGPDTAGALMSVSVSNGELVADFDERILVNNASTSTGGLYFNAELRANLFQFPNTESVEFHVNGSCEAWSSFFQSDGCWVIERADWEADVERWDEMRADGSTTITPIPSAGLDTGVILSDLTAEGSSIFWTAQDGGTAEEIVRFATSRVPSRLVGSDRAGGIVFETGDRIRWLPVGATDAIDITEAHGAARLDVVDLGGGGSYRPALVVIDHDGVDASAYYLQTREPLNPDTVRAEASRHRELFVRLEDQLTAVPGADPYYDDAYPTFLVVTDQAGDELARLRVSSDEEPYVVIHDFDGRRVLIHREPYEPAAGPRRFFVIDLECGPQCTWSFQAGPAWGALAGKAAPAGSVASDWPGLLEP